MTELLPPRERLVTLPEEFPEFSLGYGIARWIEDNLRQPNGLRAGRRVNLLPSQVKFLIHFYGVDEAGEWLYNRAVRRLPKGSGKSPFAGMMALAELLAPTRLADFDSRAPGGVVGMPMIMPLIQVAATSEDQTANTIRMVRAMANKKTALAAKYALRPMNTFIETPDGGKLQQITSSPTGAEGGELSFAVGDETEHWTDRNGGNDLSETLDQNLTKTGSRMMDTCNAWIPGVGSVAESVFDAWCLQEEGKTIGTQKVLYDARVAPPDTDLSDDASLDAALKFVYDDCWFVKTDPIKQKVWSPTYPVSRSRRFFLNQPNAAEDAWITLQDWSVLADPERSLMDGEDVVLFFDGSKSHDHTALVGCCMTDGHVFTIGVWAPGEQSGVVDFGKVDHAVTKAFERFNVVAFHADVREFESYVKKSWPDQFKDDLLLWAVPTGKEPAPIAWDMRSHSYQFAEAAEMCHAEITDGGFTHDGNWDTSRHVGNCRNSEFRGRMTVKKESPKSPNKIDAAVCVIGARMVYRRVLASPEWEKRNAVSDWVVYR